MFQTTVTKDIWEKDPKSLINISLEMGEKLDIFRLRYDEYFDLIEKNNHEYFKMKFDDEPNQSHKIANRIAEFSSTFAKRGIDNYLFKEDYLEIISTVINSFKESLVIPKTMYNSLSKTISVDIYNYTVYSTRVEPYWFKEVVVGSCDRSLRFEIHQHRQTIENGMIKTEITLHSQGLKHKDFDTWESINNAEKKIIRFTDSYKIRDLFKYIECEGLKELNADGRKQCSKITNLSSKRCKFCTELQQGDFDNYDNEPDYSELDVSAEDEALHYMKLDNDIEIARGNMALWNYTDTLPKG